LQNSAILKANEKMPRILCVDDEPANLRVLEALLLSNGYQVAKAANGQEAVSILITDNIDLILLDVMMPKIDGFELCKRIKENGRLRIIPIIMITALTSKQDRIKGIEAGAEDFISKPFDRAEVMARIRMLLKLKELSDLTVKQNQELKQWNDKLVQEVQEQTLTLQRQNQDLLTANGKLQKNFNDIILSFSNLIELRHQSMWSHSNNVARITKLITERMGFEQVEADRIVIAARLHDIGKIGSRDDTLLTDRNDLMEDQIKEYEEHPIRGQTVVDVIDDMKQIGLLIRGHHERYDGSGFPDRLYGSNIPLGSRIIALADRFDRQCHIERKRNEVLETMEALLESELDPQLYPFLLMIADEAYKACGSTAEVKATRIEPGYLSPGMCLLRDVRSGTGILLLPAGTVLDEDKILALKRHFLFDPPQEIGVYVNCLA